MNNPKIIVRNKGGVGNQLFIYAFSKVLSLELNCNLIYDNYSGFKNDFYKRTNRLDYIVNPQRKTSKNINKNLYAFLKLLPDPITIFFGYKIIVDNPQELILLDINKLKKLKYIFIDGYFQSYKYFYDKKKLIFDKQIIFKNFKLNKEYKSFKNKIDKNSISIHVRRHQYSIALDDNYYHMALSLFDNLDGHIFIFSDDLNSCKEIFKGKRFIFVETRVSDEIQELYLLTLFENQIISNSTFSYWGAMLSYKSEINVIAPKNPGIGVKNNFYPSNWKTI